MLVYNTCHAQRSAEDSIIDRYYGQAYGYMKRAEVKVHMKDYRGGIADCDTSLRFRPGFTDAIAIRGDAKLGLRNYKGAIADFDTILDSDPINFRQYFRKRSVAKFMLMDYADASADEKKAAYYAKLYPDASFANGGPDTTVTGPRPVVADTHRLAAKPHMVAPGPPQAAAEAHIAVVKAEPEKIFKNTWLEQYKKDSVLTPLKLSRAIGTEADKAPLYAVRGLIARYQKRNEDACADFKTAKELGYKEADEMIKAYCH